MIGRTCRLDRLSEQRHADALVSAQTATGDDRGWTYLGVGPWPDVGEYRAWLRSVQHGRDPSFWAITDLELARAGGFAALMAAQPATGSIEIGWVYLTPSLRGTTAATEAMSLMLRRVFDENGYRRCEWKCDSLNAASRAAATRLGFRYEGTFRQHQVVKGRNRDTAWYAMLDHEWPAVRRELEAWLQPSNFDGHGRQRRRLAAAPSRS